MISEMLAKIAMPLVSVLVLGVVIFIHELGHFLLAKWNNIGVIEFAVGFGKKIWRKRIGDTFYSIGLIPLGGYVRMVGDDPRERHCESDLQGVGEGASALEGGAPLEELNQELLKDRSRWFLEKGYFAKAAVVLAGPGFNLVSAFLFSVALIWYYGKAEPIETPIIGAVVPANPASDAGLLAKDRVVSVNGKPISTWEELAKFIADSNGEEMDFIVERISTDPAVAPEQRSFKLRGIAEEPEMTAMRGADAKPAFRIGIQGDVIRVPVSFGESVVLGARSITNLSFMVLKSLELMIKGAVSPKNIAGPIFIFGEAARSARQGMERLGSFVIFLSVTLAIMNLLPIPILDGGHLVFFTIEAIKGSPINLKVQEFANQVGMVVLLLLMVFAVGNDLFRFFT